MKKNIAIAAVLLLVLGFLIWRSQTTQVIKRQCKALIGLADQSGGGVGLFDLNRLESLLDTRIEFEIEAVSAERETAGQVEVISAYQWMGENVKKSSFKIVEFTSIEINGDVARVKSQVEGVLEMPDIRMMDGTYFVEFVWLKDDRGDWRLSEFIWR